MSPGVPELLHPLQGSTLSPPWSQPGLPHHLVQLHVLLLLLLEPLQAQLCPGQQPGLGHGFPELCAIEEHVHAVPALFVIFIDFWEEMRETRQGLAEVEAVGHPCLRAEPEFRSWPVRLS